MLLEIYFGIYLKPYFAVLFMMMCHALWLGSVPAPHPLSPTPCPPPPPPDVCTLLPCCTLSFSEIPFHLGFPKTDFIFVIHSDCILALKYSS